MLPVWSLHQESLPFVLATVSEVLSVVATNVITFCFVFLNLIGKTKKRIMLGIKLIFNDFIRKDEEMMTILRPSLISIVQALHIFMHGFGNDLGVRYGFNDGARAKHHVSAGKYAGTGSVSKFIGNKKPL